MQRRAVAPALAVLLTISTTGTAALSTAALAHPATSNSNDGLDLDAVLRVGISRLNPPTWDPHKVGMDYTNFTTFPVYDRILDSDATGAVVPGLAESWEFDADGSTLTLHIRSGATFHDGSPVDAAAIKANLDRQLDGGADMLNAGQLSSIETVELVDDATVALHLTHPDASVPAALASRAGALVCPGQFDSPELTTEPCGAGPFRLVSHRDDDRTVYERFDEYWNREHVLLGGLEFIYVADETTRVNSFQADQFDVTFVNSTAIDTALRAGVAVDPQATLTFWQMNLNRTRPPLDNVDIRRAINHALDRELLVESLLFGQGLPAGQLFPPSYYAYDADLPDPYWAYDLDEARALVEASGVDSPTFTCQISGGSGGALVPYAEAVGAMLADVGITMEIETITQSTHFTDRNTDCEIGVFAGAIEPSLAFQQLFSADGFFNAGREASDEVTAAFQATLVPGDDRDAAIGAMVELALDQSLVVPLFFPYRTYLKSERVVGLDIFPVDTTTRFVDVGLAG